MAYDTKDFDIPLEKQLAYTRHKVRPPHVRDEQFRVAQEMAEVRGQISANLEAAQGFNAANHVRLPQRFRKGDEVVVAEPTNRWYRRGGVVRDVYARGYYRVRLEGMIVQQYFHDRDLDHLRDDWPEEPEPEAPLRPEDV